MNKNFNGKEYLRDYRGNFCWNYDFLNQVRQAESFTACVDVALKVIEGIENTKNICMICGPITTPAELYDQNVWDFASAINIFSIENYDRNKLVAFDQLVFENTFARLSQNYDDYPPVIEEFYQPVFESGLVKSFCFLPKWKNSFGARKENKILTAIEAEISYLSEAKVLAYKPLYM